MRKVSWDLSALSGEQLRIRVYDLSPRGHVAADAFRVSGCKDSLTEMVSAAAGAAQIAGGGWKLVRRVKQGAEWHPATDNLQGTDVYGNAAVDYELSDLTFSVRFVDDDFDEFLFALGDFSRWMVVKKEQISMHGGASTLGSIVQSSKSGRAPATALWNMRSSHPEDPQLSVSDIAGSSSDVVYSENSARLASNLWASKGANVYIRNGGPSARNTTSKELNSPQRTLDGRHGPGGAFKAVTIDGVLKLTYDLQQTATLEQVRFYHQESVVTLPEEIAVERDRKSVV